MTEESEFGGTVVFTGAGASRAFGLPLTADILPAILRRSREGAHPRLFPGAQQKRNIEKLTGVLFTLYRGLRLDTPDKVVPNITNVLSLFDHLIVYDWPAGPRLRRDALIEARRLLERAVVEVLLGDDLSPLAKELDRGLEELSIADRKRELSGSSVREMAASITFPATANERAILERFNQWLLRKRRKGPLTIVSTNYDVAVETELFKSGAVTPQQTDLGFDWRHPFTEEMVPRPEKPAIAYYKLHGSFNWLRCELCGQLYVNALEPIAYLAFNESQVFANTCTCGNSPLHHLIVAPSMVRDVRDPHLLNVWRCATERLRTAEEWIIIGYSLPPEDLAIRSMLLRAYAARGFYEHDSGPWENRALVGGPRITVVQLGSDAKPAYDLMFPTNRFLTGGLEEFLRDQAG